VPFAAMRHQEIIELSLAWRRRRILQPLLRRLRLQQIVVPSALEELIKHYKLHLNKDKSVTWRRRRMLWPLLRRLRLWKIVAPPELSKY